jgi:hypothetical protein
MSRGLGRLQRYLFVTLRQSDKPLTFAEILKIAYPLEPHEYQPVSWDIRSLRRALHKMVKDGAVLALGAGGPADPHRYCPHPILEAFIKAAPRSVRGEA